MMWDAIFLVVLLILFVIVGAICGLVSLSRVRELSRRLGELETQIRSLRHRLQKESQASRTEDTVRGEAPPGEKIPGPVPAGPAQSAPIPALKPSTPPVPQKAAPRAVGPHRLSLEIKLGTRWLNWVGMVMMLVGVGFFLKYAYDNAWIGPKGRLAIGMLLGVVALALGERFRRREWGILFQVLTGGGIAAFYLCAFFSFQVYHLSDQTLSMLFAILITALAVVMAVAHDALSIAILGLIGGFLSPVLLSTGTNHPYALFTYVAILDLVAMGVAYFRRWRALDLLCFLGTSLLYQGWYMKFYAPDQIMPALLYISLFYLMFLLIPTFHALVRRLAETGEGLAIVVLNAAFSFFCYYDILFRDYRHALGFVVLGQALLVLLLFRVWITRVGSDSRTAASFLIIAMGLVTMAIPIQLKLYGVPIAWSMEGAVLIFLGIRFQQILCRAAGIVALVLAAGGLLARLPLHTEFFRPVFNVPFCSWAFVAAMAATSASLLSRGEKSGDPRQPILAGTALLLAFALACLLLSLEVSRFWTVNHPTSHSRTYETGSLVVLWSLIPAITALALRRREAEKWMLLSWVCLGIGALVLLRSLFNYNLPSPWLMVNATFAPKAFFVLSLWWCARISRESRFRLPADVQVLGGHGVLAVLLAFELERWGHYSHLITPKMGISLISAAWAIQAFVVIWLGLLARNSLLRYLGFVLFFLSVGKTVILDMSELEKVYRIVSFAASGLLLLAAGYFYQRYSARLFEKPQGEEPR